MKILAKREVKNNFEFFQTLDGHTIDSLRILKSYIEINHNIIVQFCKRWDLDVELFLKNLFISVYLHDLGKLTKEFQNNIFKGKSSQRYPHAYYSFFLMHYIDYERLIDIPIEKLAVLGHHTQLHLDIYGTDENFEVPTFLEEEIISFVDNASTVYNDMDFKKYFSFDNLTLNNGSFKLKKAKVRKLIKKNVKFTDKYNQKVPLKSIFSYFFSILQLCDDYSSANFSSFVKSYQNDGKLFGPVLGNPEEYVTKLRVENPLKLVFGKYEPYEFQKELFDKLPIFSLLFAPCGRGKTEASLAWALKCLDVYKRNKIIFAMPTQVTGNAMWERLCIIFGEGDTKKERFQSGKEYVGLFHGKSFIKLKSELKESDDDFKKNLDKLSGEVFKGNVYFKPITVTTIDHLIYSFVHGFKQSDFALGNLQNAIIVFDEVHYYEKKTLDHLFTLFRMLREFEIPHLLMSGTIPQFIKEPANNYVEIKDEEGLNYLPFVFKIFNKHLISSEKENGFDGYVDENILNEISNQYDKGLKQFIIINTIKKSQEFYKILKYHLNKKFKDPNIVLYHSQFTYNDRVKKEAEILRKSNEKRPFILIATQVIEISLDISCDIMYTDFAPPDAIGQRAGRLNRKGKTFKNGVVHELRIFNPENHLPYEEDLLERTMNMISEGPTSYNDIKRLCDDVYFDREIIRTNLIKFFKKSTLFGYKPIDIVFSEDEGRSLVIREEKMQKIDVIPAIIYQNEEFKLNVENQVKIPYWWYKKDLKENGEDLEFFEIVSKKVGRDEKDYVICKMAYNYELGFDHGKKEEIIQLDNIM